VAGLEQGVADEGALGLVRLGQAQLAGGDDLEAAVQQGGDLWDLAGIVGGGDELGALFKRQRHPASLSKACVGAV
jgi:hypothetical protein